MLGLRALSFGLPKISVRSNGRNAADSAPPSRIAERPEAAGADSLFNPVGAKENRLRDGRLLEWRLARLLSVENTLSENRGVAEARLASAQ